MTTAARRGESPLPPSIPTDPALPGARELLRPEGIGALAHFLARSGWRLQSARPVQALYQPGRSLVVRYRAEGVNGHGETRMLWLCAETRDRTQPNVAPPDFDPRSVPAEPVASMPPYLVWSFPYDPSLPAMADAGRGPVVRQLLVGLDRRAVAVSVEPVRYRPHRRATFRYTILRGSDHGAEILYGKVLPPARAAAVLEAGQALGGRMSPGRLRRRRRSAAPRLSLPLAGAFGGLLLYEPLAGRPLRDLLLAGGSLPSPDRMPRLLDELAGLGADVRRPGGDARRDPARMLHHSRRVLVHILPELAGRVDRLVDSLLERVSRDPAPTSLVHGDLYDAQVFVEGDYSLGLIDLDDLGPGDPTMDAANFCAHLLALAMAVPAASPLIRAYRRLARPAFAKHLGVAESSLAWREALVMLLLATGPFRVLDPRWPAEVPRRVDLAARLFAQEL